MKIEGTEAAVRKFKTLEKRGARRVLNKAVRAAAAPVVKGAKRTAPRETGLLKKAIGQKVKVYRRGQYVLAVIGAKSKKDAETGRNPAHYLHLVESGTKRHDIEAGEGKRLAFPAGGRLVRVKAVSHPGAKPSRFLETAYRTRRAESIARFKQKFSAEVEAEAAKG